MDKTQVFREKVYAKKGKDFDVVGQYTRAKDKIEMVHRVCGYQWQTLPDNFLKTKFGCPKCSGNAKLTDSEFKDKVYKAVGVEYSVLSDYINARAKVSFKHNVCGYTYETTPESFLNLKTRCAKCAGVLKRTDAEFKNLVQGTVGTEYTFLEEYTNRSTSLDCIHNVCGYVWKAPPANFLYKQSRCPNCAGNAPLTHELFEERVYDLHGGDYQFLEKYKNFTTPLKCRHVCGHEWTVAPNNLLQGKECPRCKRESKGERYVRNLLDKEGITHKTQQIFEGCKYVNSLPFDFYIPEINLAIEYDGEQHYRPVNFGGRPYEVSLKMFEVTKIRDGIKTKYCKDNNINLLRIPYYLSKDEIKDLVLTTVKK